MAVFAFLLDTITEQITLMEMKLFMIERFTRVKKWQLKKLKAISLNLTNNLKQNIMFVINQQKGIGEVLEVLENAYLVYFEETDEEKKLLKAFTTIYNTIEDAELALNPELSSEDVEDILTNIEENKRQAIEANKAAQWLEEHNIEASKKLMRNI